MIRPAELKDVPGIINLGQRIHWASAFKSRPYRPERVAQRSVQYINRDDYTILLAEYQGLIVGIIPAWISDSAFTFDRIACEEVIYVQPEYRRFRYGIQLIRAYINWAKSQGANDIRIGNIGGMTDDEQYNRLLSRLGFTRTGGMYVMR